MDALVNRLNNSVNCCRRRFGFTIIELLIVMSLLGIATTLVSAAYLSFEKRERVKSAALDLKSNLRLAQNKALSGDKGIPGSPAQCNNTSQTLIGWFVRIDTDTTIPVNNYEIMIACQNTPGDEEHYVFKNVDLPEGVSFTDFEYSNDFVIAGSFIPLNNTGLYKILFRTLDREIYVFDDSPSFYDSDGNFNKLWGSTDVTGQIAFKLAINGFDTTYEVTAFTDGEINEKKL